MARVRQQWATPTSCSSSSSGISGSGVCVLPGLVTVAAVTSACLLMAAATTASAARDWTHDQGSSSFVGGDSSNKESAVFESRARRTINTQSQLQTSSSPNARGRFHFTVPSFTADPAEPNCYVEIRVPRQIGGRCGKTPDGKSFCSARGFTYMSHPQCMRLPLGASD